MIGEKKHPGETETKEGKSDVQIDNKNIFTEKEIEDVRFPI